METESWGHPLLYVVPMVQGLAMIITWRGTESGTSSGDHPGTGDAPLPLLASGMAGSQLLHLRECHSKCHPLDERYSVLYSKNGHNLVESPYGIEP